MQLTGPALLIRSLFSRAFLSPCPAGPSRTAQGVGQTPRTEGNPGGRGVNAGVRLRADSPPSKTRSFADSSARMFKIRRARGANPIVGLIPITGLREYGVGIFTAKGVTQASLSLRLCATGRTAR